MTDEPFSLFKPFEDAYEQSGALPNDAIIIHMECLDTFNFRTKIAPFLKKIDHYRLAGIDNIYLQIGENKPQLLKNYICDLTTAEGAKAFWDMYLSGNLIDENQRLVSLKIFLVAPLGRKSSDLHDLCDEIQIPAEVGAKILRPTLFSPATSRADPNLSRCVHAVLAQDIQITGINSRTIVITLPKNSCNTHLAVKQQAQPCTTYDAC